MATLVIMLVFANPFSGPPAGSHLSLVVLVVWVVSPYLALVVLGRILVATRAAALVALGGGVVASVFGLVVLTDGLLVHASLINTLLLMAVPWIQWGIVALTAAVLAALHVVWRRRTRG